MSRIGKKSIVIPDKVKVKLDGQKISDPNFEFVDGSKLLGRVLQLGKKSFRRIVI